MFETSTKTPFHDPFGLYRRLLETRAQELCGLLVNRLIRRCQLQTTGVLGYDGFKNLWEEMCIVIRNDHPLRDSYESHLKEQLNDLVMALPAIDQQTLWLMTYPGSDYAMSPEWLPDLPPPSLWPSRDPKDWPVNSRKIAAEIFHDQVLDKCVNYDNRRIRAYEGR